MTAQWWNHHPVHKGHHVVLTPKRLDEAFDAISKFSVPLGERICEHCGKTIAQCVSSLK